MLFNKFVFKFKYFHLHSNTFMFIHKVSFEFKYFYSNLNIFIRSQILLCCFVTYYLNSNIFMLFRKFFNIILLDQYKVIPTYGSSKSFKYPALSSSHLFGVFLQKSGSLDEWKDRWIEVRDCHRSMSTEYCGPEMALLALVSAVKDQFDGFLCGRNGSPGHRKSSNFHFVFLLGVLEARSCEKGALRKAYVLKLCGLACSEVWLGKPRVVVVPT